MKQAYHAAYDKIEPDDFFKERIKTEMRAHKGGVTAKTEGARRRAWMAPAVSAACAVFCVALLVANLPLLSVMPGAEGAQIGGEMTSAEIAAALRRTIKDGGEYTIGKEKWTLPVNPIGGELNVEYKATGERVTYGQRSDIAPNDDIHSGEFVYAYPGISLYAAKGTPVLAVEDGAVTVAGGNNVGANAPYSTNMGYYLILTHTNGVRSIYAHLSGAGISVKAGDTVTRGQQIGVVGNSGSGKHLMLYFALMRGKEFLEPVFAPTTSPFGPDSDARKVLTQMFLSENVSQLPNDVQEISKWEETTYRSYFTQAGYDAFIKAGNSTRFFMERAQETRNGDYLCGLRVIDVKENNEGKNGAHTYSLQLWISRLDLKGRAYGSNDKIVDASMTLNSVGKIEELTIL